MPSRSLPAGVTKVPGGFRQGPDVGRFPLPDVLRALRRVPAVETFDAYLVVLEPQSSLYPFLAALSQIQYALREVTGKPYAWYLQELARHEDRLLDVKEGILDPIRRFMGGSQKAVYDEARAYLSEQGANFGYGETRPQRAGRSWTIPTASKATPFSR